MNLFNIVFFKYFILFKLFVTSVFNVQVRVIIVTEVNLCGTIKSVFLIYIFFCMFQKRFVSYKYMYIANRFMI